MNEVEIKSLAEKIAAGIASDGEIQLYNRLCDSFAMNNEAADDDVYGNKKALASDLKHAIFEKAGIKTKVVKIKRHKWVAAASVIVMMSAISFFLLHKQPAKQQLAVKPTNTAAPVNDIAPGKTGAILTLSTGEKILLDSSANGAITKQGDASVTKQNGELVYNSEANAGNVVYNTMTTPNGRQFSLVLADGSKVWLNAASSITYPTAFVGKERKVTITGEAYFEVAHNAAMPFIVAKGNASVLVLGTHFNVNAYDDEKEIRITLLEGSIQVSNSSQHNIIKPGQQARLQEEGKISLFNDIDVDDVMAWKNGRMHFNGADIETVMRQMSRWYDVEIVYNKKLDDLFYADIPRITMLSDVLKALELTKGVRFKIEGRKIIVMP